MTQNISFSRRPHSFCQFNKGLEFQAFLARYDLFLLVFSLETLRLSSVMSELLSSWSEAAGDSSLVFPLSLSLCPFSPSKHLPVKTERKGWLCKKGGTIERRTKAGKNVCVWLLLSFAHTLSQPLSYFHALSISHSHLPFCSFFFLQRKMSPRCLQPSSSTGTTSNQHQ